MKKYEIIIEQVAKHYSSIVVEADEAELDTVLDNLDEESIEAPDDYVDALNDSGITVLEYNEDYGENPKEVEFFDITEVKDEED